MVDASTETIVSALTGIVVRSVAADTEVEVGTTVAIVECMKMEYAVLSSVRGRVRSVLVVDGQAVNVGDLLVEIEASDTQDSDDASRDTPNSEPPDDAFLGELHAREYLLRDEARPAAREKRHGHGL